MATLTGAQAISTGKSHAAIVTNSEDWEKSCVQAGRMSGDLCVSVFLSTCNHYSLLSSYWLNTQLFLDFIQCLAKDKPRKVTDHSKCCK